MLFNSPGYYFFLILIFCLYWLLSPRHQNLLLLLGSYLFYGLWDFHFLYLIFLCSLSAHVVSQKIFNEKNQSRKKFYLGIGIAVNFASLLYFKYFNFFIDSLQSLLSLAGISSGLNYLDVVLPVGISFFTFQAATFIIDVYKDKIKSIPSVIDFFLYISFSRNSSQVLLKERPSCCHRLQKKEHSIRKRLRRVLFTFRTDYLKR